MSIQNKFKSLTLDKVLSILSAVFLVIRQIKAINNGDMSLEVVSKVNDKPVEVEEV